MTTSMEYMYYLELGFDAIPLYPNSKIPYRKGWPYENPLNQWRSAPLDSNIGVRAGGDAYVAFLDLDEKKISGTYENAENWLARLGYSPGDYPVVRTASGIGRHIWVKFQDLQSGHVRQFLSSFGAGDFRFGCAAMVVAPDSVIGLQQYTLISGQFMNLPIIKYEHIKDLLEPSLDYSYPKRMSRRIRQKTQDLIHGKGIERYRSRSEAEQAIVTSLVNQRWDYGSILDVFKYYPCAGKFQGKFSRSEKEAENYLRCSYDKAVNFIRNNESDRRKRIMNLVPWIEQNQWLGRSGLTSQAILLAHCQIALRAGSFEYNASCRELADMAGVSSATAYSTSIRLVNEGYLKITRHSSANYASEYSFGDKLRHILTEGGEYMSDFDSMTKGFYGKTIISGNNET